MKSFIRIIALFVASAAVLPAYASVIIKQSAPSDYTVQDGDTLWDIATLYLNKPWQWPELWRNNTYIENPHLIYPGDKIRLLFNENGIPELVLTKGERIAKKEIRLSPRSRKQIKEQTVIPLISWSLVQHHIDNDSVMTPESYAGLPYLLGDQEGGVRYANGDIVLTKSSQQQFANQFTVIRKQGEVLDSDGNLLGIKVRHVADAKALDTSLRNEILINVMNSNFEAKRGDKLASTSNPTPEDDIRLEPATTQLGRIVDSLQQHSLLGKYDAVVLDLGKSEVHRGLVMGIYMQGPAIVDGETPYYQKIGQSSLDSSLWKDTVEQPALKVGELIIFATFDKTSFGLVTSSTNIIRHGAIVAKP